MNWQDFFKLTITDKAGKVFYQSQLKTPKEFAMHELIFSRFDHLNLNAVEKKKFSLGLRKILICHKLFKTSEFKKSCKALKQKILDSKENEFTLSTHGGGIYLFMHLLNDPELRNKKITCFTSELPLSIVPLPTKSPVQFIFRPSNTSYLADFSTLWKESDNLKLFELKDFKASA